MRFFIQLYAAFFMLIQKFAGDWLVGLAARLIFASVLLVYFFNSALTKVGTGFPDFLLPNSGAYAQILPALAEAVSYDVSQIAFFPYGLIVTMGTWAEFALPVLILIGLFTRISALAMMGFIAVMTYVDINFHGLEAKSIGAPFDRVHDALVWDQRLLWMMPLLYLLINGPGFLSVDGLIRRSLRK